MKINRNIFAVEQAAEALIGKGLRYVCAAPGSRSAPLIIGFGNSEKLKTYVIPDERSAAFFALGLAKASGLPAVLICTSGTAAAEFFPAIVEAYQERVPMLICTADRPPSMQNCGANQTINQNKLYGKYSRLFIDMGLPDVTEEYITSLRKNASAAWETAVHKDRGPVHLNFPFAKPLEPESYTDDITLKITSTAIGSEDFHSMDISAVPEFDRAAAVLNKAKKILILAGPRIDGEEYGEEFQRFAAERNIPVLADGASGLRSCAGETHKNIIVNYDAFLRHPGAISEPDTVIQFGKAHTSPIVEEWLHTISAEYFTVNTYGDYHAPSRKAAFTVPLSPDAFCKAIAGLTKDFSCCEQSYFNEIKALDEKTEHIKTGLFDSSDSMAEGTLVRAVQEALPEGSSIMLSNSLPVRLFDWLASAKEKAIRVYASRGASGIDGITSTALGIAAASEKPVLLITGDIAFYHDITALLPAVQYHIPLTIVLLNNGGGGIFSMLPIAKSGSFFSKFFNTPHNIGFQNIAGGFGCAFSTAADRNEFEKLLNEAVTAEETKIIEVKTNAEETLKLLNDLREKTKELL